VYNILNGWPHYASALGPPTCCSSWRCDDVGGGGGRNPRVHVPAVQLQGRDAVGSEPAHQVTDPPDEGAQRVHPVLGRIRLADEPGAASTGQTPDQLQLSYAHDRR